MSELNGTEARACQGDQCVGCVAAGRADGATRQCRRDCRGDRAGGGLPLLGWSSALSAGERGRACRLKLFFMKYLDPGEHVLFPVVLSVRADVAVLLREMADEMGTTMDELISALAEDSACDLESYCPKERLEDVVIPDKCSTEDLLSRMD